LLRNIALTVYLAPWNRSNILVNDANRLYDEAGTFDCIQKGDLVAVKLHAGEFGNPNYVQPVFIHEIVRRVKEAGGKPFLTDSNTLYVAQRHNAYDHMVTAQMNGYHMAPFIVADGLKSENYRLVKTKGILDEIEVSGAIAEADAMIVVSHCKGHELSGFGGAIKNLGMGCTPWSGKLRQHRTIGITIDTSKCTGCGKCKAICPKGLPDIIEGKAHNTSKECMRCPMCIGECPMDAISFTDKPNLCRALASAALGVLRTFAPKKVSYVSFAKDITEFCDCLPNPGQIVAKDIGVLASDSAVSIDAAFLSMFDYMRFNEAYGVDCLLQVQEAKAIGVVGDLKPKIKTLQ
jgi:uncharacterized protein